MLKTNVLLLFLLKTTNSSFKDCYGKGLVMKANSVLYQCARSISLFSFLFCSNFHHIIKIFFIKKEKCSSVSVFMY